MPSFRSTSASNSITFRLRLDNIPGTLAKAMSAIGETGGNIGAIDIVRVEQNKLIRDITVNTGGDDHIEEITHVLNGIEGVDVMHWSDQTFIMHLGGKLDIRSKVPLKSRDQLAMAYTPGVARVCMAIHHAPDKVYKLTIKGNTVAVVSDGTAVLGLGDIGPEAAMPVMEGKAQLFKEFAGVNAFPICLATKDVDEIVETVKRLAPTFGGINLEDISAPRCFEIERRLKEELDIPVFHDDQHGTAVVMAAGIINALKIVNKKPQDLKVVMLGIGAAGTACTNMLIEMGVTNIIGADRSGAIHRERTDLTKEKMDYALRTNPHLFSGSIHEILQDADVFIGLSAPDQITVEDLKKMAPNPIVFAMANPDPEIKPELAYPHVAVMATGRSDYPNQINNVLCFPGLFKGVLECRAKDINMEMKMAAAYAIAASISDEELYPSYIIPSVFDKRVATKVAEAVKNAAYASGAARRNKK
ncbi:MAG TPA: NAD-dependent malic enzyme [Rhodothermales bacterium]|nr:NAD-dependent malic enzyme [Rhodothermales bacterium]HRR07400.1 NAD-dependent malic enzyme [Rhodothermales bacterium]